MILNFQSLHFLKLFCKNNTLSTIKKKGLYKTKTINGDKFMMIICFEDISHQL